jgi:DUF1016 N-terminal domain
LSVEIAHEQFTQLLDVERLIDGIDSFTHDSHAFQRGKSVHDCVVEVVFEAERKLRDRSQAGCIGGIELMQREARSSLIHLFDDAHHAEWCFFSKRFSCGLDSLYSSIGTNAVIPRQHLRAGHDVNITPRSSSKVPAAPTGIGQAHDRLLDDIRHLIETAREQTARAVNSALVGLYWHIGTRIRHDVLQGKGAEYGENIVQTLSAQLTVEYGRGFVLCRLVQRLTVSFCSYSSCVRTSSYTD